ncbi:beta-ketoacyl reductase [Streptomyces sp. 4N509B]|uniref:beta-ketoacyl reductase n=1 Tax=Streptomyces sp. 4N509B TaxID=3457413 RepID=UPI003FCFFCEB
MDEPPAGRRWAVLGHDGLGVGAAIQDGGHAVDSYTDLDAILAALDVGIPAPEFVLAVHAPRPATGRDGHDGLGGIDGDGDGDGVGDGAAEEAARLLERWRAEERLADSRLVVVVNGTLATTPDAEPAHPAGSAVWQRVHAAQHTTPHRFLLVDLDGPLAADLLPEAVPAALAANEPRLAVHGETVLVPRLHRALPPAAPGADDPRRAALGGTVLLTGSGPLTAAVARHLASEAAPRRLTVAGPDAEGLTALAAELSALPVDLETVVGDPVDAAWLAAVLKGAAAEEPLTAVIDTSGSVEAVHHLDRLTADLPLGAFACCTGRPEPRVEALARRRRAHGLPALALSGVDLPSDAATEPADEALAQALPQALTLDRPAAVVTRLDGAALRRASDAGTLPAELRALAAATETAPPGRRVAAGGTGPAAGTDGGEALARRLADLTEADRERALTLLVRQQIAAVLGHSSAQEVDPERPIKDLGFDSMMAVQLRNRLVAETGLDLPTTLAFAHPTPAALAGYLGGRLQPTDTVGSRLLDEIERLDVALAALDADHTDRSRIAKRLQALAWRLGSRPDADDTPAEAVLDDTVLDSVTDDEMFELIDRELGEL